MQVFTSRNLPRLRKKKFKKRMKFLLLGLEIGFESLDDCLLKTFSSMRKHLCYRLGERFPCFFFFLNNKRLAIVYVNFFFPTQTGELLLAIEGNPRSFLPNTIHQHSAYLSNKPSLCGIRVSDARCHSKWPHQFDRRQKKGPSWPHQKSDLFEEYPQNVK